MQQARLRSSNLGLVRFPEPLTRTSGQTSSEIFMVLDDLYVHLDFDKLQHSQIMDSLLSFVASVRRQYLLRLSGPTLVYPEYSNLWTVSRAMSGPAICPLTSAIIAQNW